MKRDNRSDSNVGGESLTSSTLTVIITWGILEEQKFSACWRPDPGSRNYILNTYSRGERRCCSIRCDGHQLIGGDTFSIKSSVDANYTGDRFHNERLCVFEAIANTTVEADVSVGSRNLEKTDDRKSAQNISNSK
ncbi:unnamed protein product [Nesidiocoris tenuis]|uniref:Uncharacterized protein n=1 Tax=Nesidiocoris tenuis TaxID=355587 RepID=A0A6H5FXQ0_9HEMI|nr:unnamed protein product [Nesidiocoris tenuis]